MGRAPSFVALDFETANYSHDSPCALGLVVVEKGAVVEERSWLIAPEVEFETFHIGVHGIRPIDVAGEPCFEELWFELEPYLAGRLLAAHNAAFDRAVLLQTCETYGIQFDPPETLCTWRLTRGLYRFKDYKLPTVCEAFGIPLNHHEAASDARACAEIVLRVSSEIGWSDALGRARIGPPTYTS